MTSKFTITNQNEDYIELENEHYKASIIRFEEFITFDCEPKDGSLGIRIMAKDFVQIRDFRLLEITPERVPKLIERLKTAAESAVELQNKLQELLP